MDCKVTQDLNNYMIQQDKAEERAEFFAGHYKESLDELISDDDKLIDHVVNFVKDDNFLVDIMELFQCWHNRPSIRLDDVNPEIKDIYLMVDDLYDKFVERESFIEAVDKITEENHCDQD